MPDQDNVGRKNASPATRPTTNARPAVRVRVAAPRRATPTGASHHRL
jgi:hypothetical protein